MTMWEILRNRAVSHPFHLLSTALFFMAILHVFVCHKFTQMAHRHASKHREKRKREWERGERYTLAEDLEKDVSFRAEVLHFLGEVEVVFGIWVLPLFLSIAWWANWATAVDYLESRNLTEPLFVIVVMSMAATRPVISFMESALRRLAQLGGGSPGCWWFAILVVGPLSGSLITEPGAMTISAVLLANQFYRYSPSERLKYATLGLLFVNISVGGVLTHFAAPPVLMVAGPWGWDTSFMLANFGWKAVIGILIATSLYYLTFRSEFKELKSKAQAKAKEEATASKKANPPVPLWITIVHLCFLGWTVFHAHNPTVFIGSFLIFIGFYQATAPHQNIFSLRPAFLVGFFLAGLVIHGGLQGWWIVPLMRGLSETTLMGLAIVLTAFNDNAAITYLTTLVPDFSPALKYAVVAGAVTGGGLSVIANAPNPAGQSLLKQYFTDGISPLGLATAAAIPTAILACCFLFL